MNVPGCTMGAVQVQSAVSRLRQEVPQLAEATHGPDDEGTRSNSCHATRNKCHASSNRCLTSSNKKLVWANGLV